MRRHRVWIEIVLLGTVIAFALALLLATLGAAAGAAVSAHEGSQADPASNAQSFEGMVTCSRCGAKHQPNFDRSASNCVRTCVRDGATFALVHNDATYLLDGDLLSLKKFAGQRVRLLGFRTGNTIKVSSVTTEI